MHKYLIIIGVCAATLFALVACSVKNNPETEAEGAKVDKSFKAPTQIESKNIESFKTTFYLWDSFNEADEGGYSFSVEKNENGEYVLSEDVHYNISVPVDKSILEKIQQIIEENNLVSSNGIDKHTSGLPEEFAPCEFSAVYDSGETLYFSEDNDPEARWAKDLKELFKEEFLSQGHEELLPPVEDRTLIRFDMGYVDGDVSYSYAAIFTEEDTDIASNHYLISKYNRNTQESEYDEIVEVPENFYEELSRKLDELDLEKQQNGLIDPGGTSSMDSYAYFCMEMESGLQKNAFYEGDETKELIGLLKEVTKFLDGVLNVSKN